MSEILVAFARRHARREPAPRATYPARVARQLALAHALDARLRAGEFRDYADMARALGFTRARVSQLMDLLLLAPDIQEAVLTLEAPAQVTAHDLRPLTTNPLWGDQRRLWASLLDRAS